MTSNRSCPLPRLLLLLLLSAILADSSATNRSAAGYIVSVIQHLEATVPGSFSCVFYRMLLVDDVTRDVLRAPELGSVSKLVINRNVGNSTLARLPADNLLVLVEADRIMEDFSRFRDVMRTFGPSSRILVLVDTVSGDVQFLGLAVKQLFFCNVVYLDVKRRRMFEVDFLKKGRLDYMVDVSRLWDGRMMRNMRGRPLTFVSKGKFAAIRPAGKWLLESVALMNTTVQRSVTNCPVSKVTVLRDECYLEHFHKKEVDIDLESYHLNGVGEQGFRMLFTGMIDNMVILVPRSQLTIVQLFTYPFDWEVWIFVALLLVATEVLGLLFPTYFRNDPILLVVCGFERYDLHTAGRWEKAILLSVMQMIFFTTCAYETKLLAVMAAKPASREIKTLQEFKESGIKIKVNFLGHSNPNGTYSDLAHLMVDSTETILNMDKVHAHIVERSVAEYVLPRYYDTQQRLNRYDILKESLGIVHRLYVLGLRTPFKGVLEFTNTALIEAGLMTIYWPMKMMLESNDRIEDLPEEAGDVLFFEDMIPAWAALGVGLTLSLVAFGGELCFQRLIGGYRAREVA